MYAPKIRPYAGSPYASSPGTVDEDVDEIDWSIGDHRKTKVCSDPSVNPCINPILKMFGLFKMALDALSECKECNYIHQ
jgi:hypothetical protein